MRVALGADHAGYPLKERLARELRTLGHEVIDLGTHEAGVSVDYPDFALAVAERVARGAADRGVLVCATGIGMAIAANKVAGVRAAVVTSDETARLTRQDNDSNVIGLGARTNPDPEAVAGWLRTWLDTPFAAGRHARRVDKIAAYEHSHLPPEKP